jgi:hypothetical protein
MLASLTTFTFASIPTSRNHATSTSGNNNKERLSDEEVRAAVQTFLYQTFWNINQVTESVLLILIASQTIDTNGVSCST